MNILTTIAIIFGLLLSGCTFTSGNSIDIVHGFDKGIIWNHLYLLNDQKTAYCFDNDDFIPILKEAQDNDKKVKVTYETYLLRGELCYTGYGQYGEYDNVVVTDVEIVSTIPEWKFGVGK